MKKVMSLFTILLLSGCSAGNSINYSKEAYNKSDLTFIGIPTILGIGATGTTFPITPHYSLTAKHVAKYTMNTVLAYHPNCDIALIKENNINKTLPTFSSIGVPEKVTNYGYSFISAMPVSSEGTIVSYMKLNNSYNNILCPTLFSNMGARKGMSGGPVYSGENVVGVTISYQTGYVKDGVSYKEPGTLFVPFQNISTWLENELNKTEDKGLLKIDHNNDFYNNDSGNNEKDKIKNEKRESLIFEK